MVQPIVKVLGVYRLRVTEKLFLEQFEILYDCPLPGKERAKAERQCRAQLESIVLIEAMVSNRDERFRVEDLAQARNGKPKDTWQVAWAEAYLAANGESLLVERWSDAPAADPLRVAFFMHSWDPAAPLQTSYGEVQCPAPQNMPERLRRVVPFEPVD